MRSFNKLFVIAMPRCATVSMGVALGELGVPVAHLGHVFGEDTSRHFHPQRLQRMLKQIEVGDFDLDVLQQCRGLADYPACCMQVIRGLDRAFPKSLFVNIRRVDEARWLQSVERQFVGLQLISQRPEFTEHAFMQTVHAFREMTFGRPDFDAEDFRAAYRNYQMDLDDYFAERPEDLLTFDDVGELAEYGYLRLCQFLKVPPSQRTFPSSNSHSQHPEEAFMKALAAGHVESQTGICPLPN